MGKRFEVEVQGKMFEVDLQEGEDIQQVIAEIEQSQSVVSVPDAKPENAEELTFVDDLLRANERAGQAAFSGIANLPLSIADLLAKSFTPVARGATRPEGRITDPIREALGILDPEDLTLAESFAFGGGEVILPGAGAGKFLAGKIPQLTQIAKTAPGKVKRFFARQGVKIGETFKEAPIAFTVAEVLPGGAGRVGAEITEERGGGPLAQAGVGLATAITAGVAPTVAINLTRRIGTSILNTLLAPFKAGGMARAARTTQARAVQPIDETLAKIDAAPEGVTGAQASEDLGLLAQQAKALEDNPVLAQQIDNELLAARIQVQDDLKATFGDGTTPGDFQHAVVQSVAAPGAVIVRGQTDEMLRAAAGSFDEAYQAARGHPIRIGSETTPGHRLTDLVEVIPFRNDLGVSILPAEREAMSDLLGSLAKTVEEQVAKRAGQRMPKNAVASDALLEMRRRIRKMQRRKMRAGATGERAEAEAAILQVASDRITKLLNQQLPKAASKALRETDAQYAQFVTVLNAAGRGNGEFTVQQLQTAIRMTTSTGRVARGEAGELATFAQQGADLKRALGKPRDAARIVRDMTPDQVQATKGDFAKVMFDQPSVRATVGDQVGISGKGLLKFLEQQKETMIALGFTPDDLSRADTMARLIKMMELRSPRAANDLLEDGPGRILDIAARIVGSLSLTRAVKQITGSGSGGAGIIIAKAGSENMRTIVQSLTLDKAASLIREAVTDRELFKALLTSSTDPVIRQIQAGRRINAFFLSIGVAGLDEANFPDEAGDDILNVEVR